MLVSYDEGLVISSKRGIVKETGKADFHKKRANHDTVDYLPKALVLDQAHETVALFHERWAWARKKLPVADDVAKAIEAQIAKVPMT